MFIWKKNGGKIDVTVCLFYMFLANKQSVTAANKSIDASAWGKF